MMNEENLIRVNWYYYSIKEQYKFINRLIKNIQCNPYCYQFLNESLNDYRTSLILFKKSLEIFDESFSHKKFNDEIIYKMKDIYLRRSLMNINKTIIEIKQKLPHILEDILIRQLLNLLVELFNRIRNLIRLLEISK